VLIGTLVAVGAAAVFVSARLTTPFLLALVVTWLWARPPGTGLRHALPEMDGLAFAFAALVLYALIGTLWAADPIAAVEKVAQLFAIAFASLAAVRLVLAESRSASVRIAEGLWLGVLIGVAFYLSECLSGQAIKIWIINALHLSPEVLRPLKDYAWQDGTLVRIGGDTFVRNATPLSVFLWPALLAARGAVARPWNTRVAQVIAAMGIAAVLLSPHESSKVALLIGLGAFAVAWRSARWGHGMLLGLWLAASLAIVPAALLAHRLELHKADWLQQSARHRIVIWNTTAEQVLKYPMFGIGTYSVYVAGFTLVPYEPQAPGDELAPSLSRHSHNAFLQVWLELGAVGAALLTLAGWQFIRRMERLDHTLRPFAVAAFSCATALMSTSYGIWQNWFMALFGLAPILFAIGARSCETAPQDAGRDSL
jgi:O-antigen ligase